MRIVLGIATSGRRDILTETLKHLTHQTRQPDVILVCPAHAQDVDREAIRALSLPARVVNGNRGSSAQRNAILNAAQGADLVVFIDDDYLPANDFLAETEHLFRAEPDVVVATGKVLADGIHGPGLTIAGALAVLERDDRADADLPPVPAYNAYGCNMAFRVSAIAEENVRFDEDLPRYGWQEDVDFCRRLAKFGRIVKSPALRGVHLGNKQGRSPGLPLGYSQIANPVYLVRKGSVDRIWALKLMRNNVLANIAGSLRPQGIVDRRGRLKGNMLAILDLFRGRISPKRILEFHNPQPSRQQAAKNAVPDYFR